jgi:hypothetical protein
MNSHPTSTQRFAMSLLFRGLRECPYNRTPKEYEQIKSRIPKRLKVVHGIINEQLNELAQSDEFASWERCDFKAGDEKIHFEPYPKSISIETVRLALIGFGWREPQERRRLSL